MIKNLNFLSLFTIFCLSCGQNSESTSQLNDVQGIGSDLERIHVFYQEGEHIKYGLYTQGLAMPSRHEDLEDIKSIPKKNYLEMLELSLDHAEPLKTMSLEEASLINKIQILNEKRTFIQEEIDKTEGAIKKNTDGLEYTESRILLVRNAISGINDALRSSSTPSEEHNLLNERKADYIHTLTELNLDLEAEQRFHIKLQADKSILGLDQTEQLKDDLRKINKLLSQHREIMEEQRKDLRAKVDHIKSFFTNNEALALYEGQKLYNILLIPFEHESWGLSHDLKLEVGKFSQQYDQYNRPAGDPHFFPMDYEIKVNLDRTGIAYISLQLENLWCENKLKYRYDFKLEKNSKTKVVRIKGKPYGSVNYTITNVKGADTLIYYRILN